MFPEFSFFSKIDSVATSRVRTKTQKENFTTLLNRTINLSLANRPCGVISHAWFLLLVFNSSLWFGPNFTQRSYGLCSQRHTKDLWIWSSWNWWDTWTETEEPTKRFVIFWLALSREWGNQPLHWYIGDENSLIPYESGQLVLEFAKSEKLKEKKSRKKESTFTTNQPWVEHTKYSDPCNSAIVIFLGWWKRDPFKGSWWPFTFGDKKKTQGLNHLAMNVGWLSVVGCKVGPVTSYKYNSTYRGYNSSYPSIRPFIVVK